MSKVHNFPNITMSVCKILRALKNSQGEHLSGSAQSLYLHFYDKNNFFGKRFETSRDEAFDSINCKKTKFYEIIAELELFNLIQTTQVDTNNRKSKAPNILHITLLPPSPFALLQGTIKSLDIMHNLLPIYNACFIEGDDEEITLKHPFINLKRNNYYEDILNELEVGDKVYFVAEPIQLEDGRWELRNECNLMSEAIRGLR